jgi:hypothetical protein
VDRLFRTEDRGQDVLDRDGRDAGPDLEHALLELGVLGRREFLAERRVDPDQNLGRTRRIDVREVEEYPLTRHPEDLILHAKRTHQVVDVVGEEEVTLFGRDSHHDGSDRVLGRELAHPRNHREQLARVIISITSHFSLDHNKLPIDAGPRDLKTRSDSHRVRVQSSLTPWGPGSRRGSPNAATAPLLSDRRIF